MSWSFPTVVEELAVPFQVISRGSAAGEYQAFPDACRLHNGDILVVFYAGYAHVSYPNEDYPRAGRICWVRSSDEGLSWSHPQVLHDDEFDNRDPHIAQLNDGTLVCSFFSLRHSEVPGVWEGLGPQLVYSYDGGQTWSDAASCGVGPDMSWYCSAPVRQLSDGTCLLPVYCQQGERAWGGVLRSTDGGFTWSEPIDIGQDSGLFLPAETDIVELADGSLYAILRGDATALRGQSDVNMQASISRDKGQTWSPLQDLGFLGHSPHFTRLSTGAIFLTHRGMPHPEYDGEDTNDPRYYWQDKFTSLRASYDEAMTWEGPYVLDTAHGAYPASVELQDGSVLVVYYEEGQNSGIRAITLNVCAESGVQLLPVA